MTESWDTAVRGFVSVSCAKPSVSTSLEAEVVICSQQPTGYTELGTWTAQYLTDCATHNLAAAWQTSQTAAGLVS